MKKIASIAMAALILAPALSFAMTNDEADQCVKSDVGIEVLAQEIKDDASSVLSNGYNDLLEKKAESIGAAASDCATLKSKLVELKGNLQKLRSDADAILSN